MRRAIYCLMLIGAASFGQTPTMPGALGTSAATPPNPGLLRWNNGETITGEIVGATATDLTWKSPLFDEPLLLSWNALRRIDQPRAAVPITDTFSLAMRNGDVIHGDLFSITENSIHLKSSRHGDIAVKRSEVLNLRRLRGGTLLYSGPSGDVGWKQIGENGQGRMPGGNQVPTLLTAVSGALSMPYWNGKASLPITLPPKAAVEFVVRSSARPHFRLSLDVEKQALRIETCDDELVLVSGNTFKRIRKIGDDEREIGLRVCWDRAGRSCSVFSRSGELLTDWKVPVEGKGAGVGLESRGRDLSLELLRIRPWDGQPPANCDLTKPRVEMGDGRALDGRIAEASAESLQLSEPGKDSATMVPLEQVDAIVFSVDAPKVVEQPTLLTFADGTRVGGRAQTVKDGHVTVETSFTEQPLASQMENLRQWLIRLPAAKGAEPETPLSKMDRIVGEEATLHGKLLGMGDNSPHWLPVGGLKPVKPSRDLVNELFRALPSTEDPVPGTVLVFTSGGEVLPGRVNALDAKQVDLESAIFQNVSLPVESLDAIQFSPNAGKNIKGFNDPSWVVLKGADSKVRRNGERINLEADSSIGNAAAMLSSEINFKICQVGFSTVRLRLFCAGTDGSKSVNLALLRNGNQLMSGMESEEGQFDEERQTNIPQTDPVPIRITIQPMEVSLYVNGVLVGNFPVPPGRRLGAGLVIEPGNSWGNGARPIELAGFSAKAEPGVTWLPEVDAESKMQALTVPRFLKENPPHQVLIAANGDVLRGEIEAATATHFGFLSGSENLRISRDRVQAAIWLKKPDPNAPASEARNPTREKLAHLVEQEGYYEGGLPSLIEYLKQEANDLKITLPAKYDGRSYQIHLGGQTIGDALQEICDHFGLAYRVEKDGSIVLESPQKRPMGLVQRAYSPDQYWLTLTNGGRIGLLVEKFEQEWITGKHPLYGPCKIAMKDVYTIRTSPPEPTSTMKSLADWRLVYAPEPVLPENGGESSPLVGKEAKTFKLATLAGGDFDLAKEKGKVVVLDFWATWCGPCVKSLPGLIEAMATFPADQVKFVGVNQGEAPDHVKEFLETRGWNLAVASDSSQSVARQYGVDGIPHTVVIGPDGKIALVKTGYSPEGEKEIAEKVRQLIEGKKTTGI